MQFDLNQDNYDILVAKSYQGVFWTSEELENDLKRIRYIKRLMGKYINRKDLNERLILNHIIILGNVFGISMACKLLFFNLEKEYWSVLRTFLLFLDYIPDHGRIEFVSNKVIDTKIIQIDQDVANRLRNITCYN